MAESKKAELTEKKREPTFWDPAVGKFLRKEEIEKRAKPAPAAKKKR
jgi:hypothetical protein